MGSVIIPDLPFPYSSGCLAKQVSETSLQMSHQEALLKGSGIGEPGPHPEYLLAGHSFSISE